MSLLSLFVPHLSFWCLGKAVLRECVFSMISLLICFRKRIRVNETPQQYIKFNGFDRFHMGRPKRKRIWKNSGICGQRRSRSACASAQPDQGLCCPLTESLKTIECVNGEQMPG